MLLCWGNWVKPVKISSKTSSNPLKPVANWKNRFLSFLNYSTVVKDVSLLVKGFESTFPGAHVFVVIHCHLNHFIIVILWCLSLRTRTGGFEPGIAGWKLAALPLRQHTSFSNRMYLVNFKPKLFKYFSLY